MEMIDNAIMMLAGVAAYLIMLILMRFDRKLSEREWKRSQKERAKW